MWIAMHNDRQSSQSGLQLIGEELRVASRMKRRGYRFILFPANNENLPLYSKTIKGVCNILRDYKEERFVIGFLWECMDKVGRE